MEKYQNENWREWHSGTTFRGGRERDLEDYEGYLGFKREDLNGKTVLDIGSGESELFSRQLKESGINAQVVSLNPDLISDSYRQEIKKINDWQKKAVAGIGQELPFKNKSFDNVLALYSVAVFSSPSINPEAAEHWMNEIVRVLKPGGEARIGGLLADKKEEIFNGPYKNLIKMLQSRRITVEVEKVKSKDLDLPPRSKSWIDESGEEHNEIEKWPEELWDARIIIKKPAK